MTSHNEMCHEAHLDPLLNKADTLKMTGKLSYPSVWRMIQAGKFPRAVQISPNRVAWRRSEVIAWMQSRPAATIQPKARGRKKVGE